MNKIRFFDLFIFTILAILSEFLSSYFFNKVGSQFYLSFATLIFIIASIRWGAYSVFVIILSGIPLLFTQNQNDVYSGILYYCIANVFAVLPILLYGRKNRNLIVKSSYKLLIYIVLVLVSLSISKGIALMIINHDYLGFYKYFVSMIFTFSRYDVSKEKITVYFDMDRVCYFDPQTEQRIGRLKEDGKENI